MARQLRHRIAWPGAICLVILAMAGMLTACSSGRPAGPGGHAVRRPGGGRVIFFAGGGYGGVVSVGVGFGQPGGGGRPAITVADIPRAGSAQAVSLPLDSYEEVATQQQNALVTANNLLVQRCMTAAGFSYPIAAPVRSGALNLDTFETQGFGLADLAQAQTYGYAQPRNSPQNQGLLEIPGFVANLNKHGAAWTSALFGFVPGARVGAQHGEGCYRMANTELFGPLGGNASPDPIPGIAFQSANWTQSDSRVLAAERRWSACMARRGFSYRTPQSAAFRNWPGTPTPIEIATAVADVGCKRQTNLVNIWLAVEAGYQQALVSLQGTQLQKLQASVDRLLLRGEELLSLPPGVVLAPARGGPAQTGPVQGVPLPAQPVG